ILYDLSTVCGKEHAAHPRKYRSTPPSTAPQHPGFPRQAGRALRFYLVAAPARHARVRRWATAGDRIGRTPRPPIRRPDGPGPGGAGAGGANAARARARPGHGPAARARPSPPPGDARGSVRTLLVLAPAPARHMGGAGSRTGPGRRVLPRDRGLALLGLLGAGLGRLGARGRLGLPGLLLRDGDVARVDVAVDAAALVELDPARADLALDDAGRLELEAALGDDGAADAAADDGVLRQHVTLHGAVLADHHGLAGADRALDGALDAERPLGLAVADDAHPGPDDRDDAVTWRLHGLVVLRHRLPTRLEVLLSSESTQHHGCLIMTRGSM